MKTFADLQKFLEAELERFPPGVDLPMTVSWVEALSPAETALADAACEAFASTRDWPVLRSDARRQVYLRLEFARAEAGRMILRTQGGNLPEEMGETEVLRYALIQRWHAEGLNWLRWLERNQKS